MNTQVDESLPENPVLHYISQREMDIMQSQHEEAMKFDFTKLKGHEILNACQDSGLGWALAFCQFTKKAFDIDLEVDYVTGWFANAIEGSSDVRRIRAEQTAALKQT